MTDLSNRLIISQQQQIAALRAQNKQLQEDNRELEQIITTILEDLETPLVVNWNRVHQTVPGFKFGENPDGDTLVYLKMRRYA